VRTEHGGGLAPSSRRESETSSLVEGAREWTPRRKTTEGLLWTTPREVLCSERSRVVRSGRVGKDGAKVKRVWHRDSNRSHRRRIEGPRRQRAARKSRREGHGGQLQANVQQLQSASPVRSMGSPMSSAKRLPCRPANRRIGCSFGGGAVHQPGRSEPWLARDSIQPDRSVHL
jgi:hypothetical protein